jgi:Inhibitor of Apoptosis domain/Zinc finger, C3HC4 type (RING finger)
MSLMKRLHSFSHWPNWSKKSCISLANAGFQYTGKRDEVQCLVCGILVEGWNELRYSALEIHRNRSPECLLISESHSLSTLIIKSGSTAIIDVSVPISNSVDKTRVGPPTSALKNEIERLKTFEDWPLEFIQPTDLAAAGFFYKPNASFIDSVECVFCEGTLHSWELEDDVNTEHWTHFPNCAFLRGYDVANIPREIAENNDSAFMVEKNTCDVLSPKEAYTCKICLNSQRNTLFQPCGHFYSCAQCAKKLRNCSICRSPIRTSIRAFLS